ncbi:MAG: DUF58 domain-containing protein [Leptospiraceae bacterium]|nr:DUF58 domain-containing protein [Leptospiraceae bacterium]
MIAWPARRFVFLLLSVLAFCVAVVIWPTSRSLVLADSDRAWQYLGGLNLALLILFLLDSWTIPARRRFRAERQLIRTFSIGYPHPVQMHIDWRGFLRRRLRTQIFDDLHEHMHTDGFQHAMILRRGRNTIDYRLRVSERGLYEQQWVYLSCYSWLGLSRRIYRIACQTRIQVYPDLKAISKYALLARRSRLGLMGVRKLRKIGGDNDFERLKEYGRDDEFKHIDWKASARANELMVRTYQKTRNQTIFFLLDCGRMMSSEHQGQSLLDHALSSMLMLAWVALSEKDQVGLLAFDGQIRAYVPPGSGKMHHRRLVQAVYNVKASNTESNFDLAFQYLHQVCRKRSLVTLLTNVNDHMNANQLHSYLASLTSRHLPFAVLLEQPELNNYMMEPPADQQALYTQAAIADFLFWKTEVIQRLKNRKVLATSALPADLGVHLINEYLRIKARHLL